MNCRQFELALADQPDTQQLSAAARAHLDECASCAAMVADFDAIATQVAQLPSLGPPVELWDEIRAQLLRDGIIHEPGECSQAEPDRPRLVRSTSSARR